MAQLGKGHIRERGRVKVTARGSMQLRPATFPPLRRYESATNNIIYLRFEILLEWKMYGCKRIEVYDNIIFLSEFELWNNLIW